MILDVNEMYQVRLKEVFEPIELISPNGERLFVCMRDGGFELDTPDEAYSVHGGKFTNLATQQPHNNNFAADPESGTAIALDTVKQFRRVATIECIKCGHKFIASPNHIKCPRCPNPPA